jgi:hypothetical protein
MRVGRLVEKTVHSTVHYWAAQMAHHWVGYWAVMLENWAQRTVDWWAVLTVL